MVAAFSSSANIQKLFATPSSAEANAGVVQALSVLLPEASRIELPNLIKDLSVRKTVLSLTMRALPWRMPDSFSPSTGKLAKQSLSMDASSTMDSLLAVSAYASAMDAYWTSSLLTSLPIDKRDRFWCGYLHKQYEDMTQHFPQAPICRFRQRSSLALAICGGTAPTVLQRRTGKRSSLILNFVSGNQWLLLQTSMICWCGLKRLAAGLFGHCSVKNGFWAVRIMIRREQSIRNWLG